MRRRSVIRGLLLALSRAMGGGGGSAADTPQGGDPKRKEPGGKQETTVTTPIVRDLDGEKGLDRSLDRNLTLLEKWWGYAEDLVVRRFRIAGEVPAAIVYLSGQVDEARLDVAVIKPLVSGEALPPQERESPGGRKHLRGRDLFTHLEKNTVYVSKVQESPTLDKAANQLASGFTILLVEGSTSVLGIAAMGAPKRAVVEPPTQPVIRGPREGFIEHLDTNVTLVRERIRHPDLRFLSFQLGRYSQTRVKVLYIEGRAPEGLIEEVKHRLGRIEIDAVVESGYIEELIEDAPYSPFPQMQATERPDVVAAALYEGRVAILTAGTPFTLIAPATFWQFLQANEDYYERYWVGSFVRLLRVALMILSITLPALYIAAVLYHPEMLPTSLLITIAAARERVPLPAALEIFIFELAFEAFREAGVRLPRPVGQTVSIVGGLIIGQAAVQAGIISAPIIVIVALTGIASFTTPYVELSAAIRILRFPLMLLASGFGLFGILIGGGFIQVHLLSLRSFGVPYLWPVAPLDLKGVKDLFTRAPWWRMWQAPHPDSGDVGDHYTFTRREGFPLRPHTPKGPHVPTKQSADKRFLEEYTSEEGEEES